MVTIFRFDHMIGENQQYIASIMSRNGVNSTREKTSTDRMLTKTSNSVVDAIKERNVVTNRKLCPRRARVLR